MAMAGGARPSGIADASLFTTQSIDAVSRKIRTQLHASTPTFLLGSAGETTVFPFASIAAIQWKRQTGTSTFSTSPLPTPAVAGAVGTIAFGSYASPDYETAAKVIPPYGTATGKPVAQGSNQVQFTLFIPAGVKPAAGWPVAIFGHGFTDSKNGAPWAVAGSLARAGIATIAINVVGHGFGALGTYTVTRTAGPQVVLPAGGRGIDQDGNGTIDSTEGVSAVGAQSLIGNRDGLRQTTIDLMQLVKVLKAGVNLDGTAGPDGQTDDGNDDGNDNGGNNNDNGGNNNDDQNDNRAADLSTSRIYYAGSRSAASTACSCSGSSRDIRAGRPERPGRADHRDRPSEPELPAARRDRADHADAVAVQRGAERVLHVVHREHAAAEPADRHGHGSGRVGDPGVHRPHGVGAAGREPGGVRAVHHATGDHPVRARRQDGAESDGVRDPAGLRVREPGDALFRNDLAYALNPAVPKNPHTFLTNIAVPSVAVRVPGAGADRDVLREQRRDGDRSGRLGAVLRDADLDGSGGPGLHPVGDSRRRPARAPPAHSSLDQVTHGRLPLAPSRTRTPRSACQALQAKVLDNLSTGRSRIRTPFSIILIAEGDASARCVGARHRCSETRNPRAGVSHSRAAHSSGVRSTVQRSPGGGFPCGCIAIPATKPTTPTNTIIAPQKSSDLKTTTGMTAPKAMRIPSQANAMLHNKSWPGPGPGLD